MTRGEHQALYCGISLYTVPLYTMIARSAGVKRSIIDLRPARLLISSLYVLLSRMIVTTGKSLLGSKSLSVQAPSLNENFLPLNSFCSARTDSVPALLSRNDSLAGDRFIAPRAASEVEGGDGGAAASSALAVFSF